MTARDDLARIVLGTDPHNGVHPGMQGFECYTCRSMRGHAERMADAVIREWLPTVLTSPAMVGAVADAVSIAQTAGHVEYKRRVGYAGRLTIARTVLDQVCSELDAPTSIDLMLKEQDA